MDKKNVAIFIEEGFEEVEALAPVDLLRRAGAEVVLVSKNGRVPVKGRCGIEVIAENDYSVLEATQFDLIIIPGGNGGVEVLRGDPNVHRVVRNQLQSGRIVGAICAAPIVLREAGLLENREITSYPGARGELEKVSGLRYSENRVVEDGNLVTSRGPGTAIEFALSLIRTLYGEEKMAEIRKQVVA